MKNVRAGIQGFYKNLTNPHHKDSQAYREWEFGYNKGYFENLERQKQYESTRSKTQAG